MKIEERSFKKHGEKNGSNDTVASKIKQGLGWVISMSKIN